VTRIVVLNTIAPDGVASGGGVASAALADMLEPFGTVEKLAIWALSGDGVTGSEWSGAAPMTLLGLRRRGLSRAVSRGLPLSVARFHRNEMAQLLSAQTDVDVFVAVHIAAWQYADAVSARRKVLYTQNVEAEMYRRAAVLEGRLARRWVWKREAVTMERFERSALRSADAVICTGIRDRNTIKECYGVDAEAWYPPLRDAKPVVGRTSEGRVVACVGTMTWQPNRWGMDWFLGEVWPAIKNSIPDATLELAGAGTSALDRGLPGVQIHGVLDDVQSVFERTDVVIAPVIGGSGVKIKVMDAAARGLPIVTTGYGAEGLENHDGFGMRVADKPEDFARAVCELLQARPKLPLDENLRWYGALLRTSQMSVRAALQL
jgi:polysaccharide biosynthesis protein PslH